MPTIDQVRRFLEQHGIEVRIFQDPTPTAETAARAVGCSVGEIAKTILLLVGGEPLAVVASGDFKVRGSKLKRVTGLTGKVRLPKAAEVTEHTGYSPGGVCPFLLPRTLRVLVDVSLRRYPVVYPAAGDDHSAVPIRVDELIAIVGGEEANVCDPLRAETSA